MLTHDVSHKADFTNTSIIGFKNDRSLEDHLVQAVLPKVDAEGRSKPCGKEKRRCEVCISVNDTSHFKRRGKGEMVNLLKRPVDRNSNHAIYLFGRKQYQYYFSHL